MLSGFTKLPRAAFHLPFTSPNGAFSSFEALFDLFSRAYFREGIRTYAGKNVHIFPGEILFSQGELAQRWRWNLAQTQTFLHALEKRGVVSLTVRNGVDVLTLNSEAQWNLSAVGEDREEGDKGEDGKKGDFYNLSSGRKEEREIHSSPSSLSSPSSHDKDTASCVTTGSTRGTTVVKREQVSPHCTLEYRDSLPPEYPREEFGKFLREYLSVPGRWPKSTAEFRKIREEFEKTRQAEDSGQIGGSASAELTKSTCRGGSPWLPASNEARGLNPLPSTHRKRKPRSRQARQINQEIRT